MNPQAKELNECIADENSAVLKLLSEKGKGIFFPKKGILAQTAEAKDKRINATVGSALEDDGSTMCLDTIAKWLKLGPGKAFPYAPSYGNPPTREKWKELLVKKNPSLKDVSISHPIVTSALTHGLSMAGYLFCDPGDSIIVSDMFWENYNLLFHNTYGANLVPFETFTKEGGFNVEAFREALEKAQGDKRIVLLNFPNNPAGYTPTIEEARLIAEILGEAAEKKGPTVAIIDDAYFGLVYEEGILRESPFALLAGAHHNLLAVKLDGPTKEDYVWGFRVGFITFGIKDGTPKLYNALESKTAGAVRGTISSASNIGQSLLLKAYNDDAYAEEKQSKHDVLRRRYMRVKELLADHSEYTEQFEAFPFNSGYFMCVKLRKADGDAVRRRLLEEYSTGVIAIGDIIRIAYSSTPLGLLPDLFHNLFTACKDVSDDQGARHG